MTIYLFIDLPFNEIGCYPTSPRDGEATKGKENRRERRPPCDAIRGAPNFLFLLVGFQLGFI